MAPDEIEDIDDEADKEEEREPLNLKVKIDSPGACQRHITVTVPREDIERYFDKAFGELMPTANVPGFRAGRAPRKLVESRFRKDVAGQVKGSLLMDSLSQVTEEQKLAAISEPDIDVAAIELPDEGPLTFEFDIEVRPEFDLPNWKGLTIERPTRNFTSKDIDQELARLLASHGRLTPVDGPAAVGDYITANFTFKDGDEIVSEIRERSVRSGGGARVFRTERSTTSPGRWRASRPAKRGRCRFKWPTARRTSGSAASNAPPRSKF